MIIVPSYRETIGFSLENPEKPMDFPESMLAPRQKPVAGLIFRSHVSCGENHLGRRLSWRVPKSWGIPNSWMVYFMEKPEDNIDDLGVPPF